MIVLDANILIRAVLGRRVRELLDTWAEARERIEDRDENDWPVLATALALACPSGRKMPTSSAPGLPSGPPTGLRSSSSNN